MFCENFSSHTPCFFYTPNLPFLPLKKISECVFHKKSLEKFPECVFRFFFPKFELEKLWKMHSKIFIQGQNEKTGGRKETRVEREKFMLDC
jgi:hypothetical protein